MPRKYSRKNLRKFRSKRRVLKSKKSSRTRKSIKNKRLSRRKQRAGAARDKADFTHLRKTTNSLRINSLKTNLKNLYKKSKDVYNNYNDKSKIIENLRSLTAGCYDVCDHLHDNDNDNDNEDNLEKLQKYKDSCMDICNPMQPCIGGEFGFDCDTQNSATTLGVSFK